MCAIKIPGPWKLEYKCHKNLFHLSATGVKYLGSMSSSMMYGISVSYLTGVTFHRVNIYRFFFLEICVKTEQKNSHSKIFHWGNTREVNVLQVASRDILYYINKQIGVLMHPFNQTSYNLRCNKTPLVKQKKNYYHISYSLIVISISVCWAVSFMEN